MSAKTREVGIVSAAIRHPAFMAGIVLSSLFLVAALLSLVWTPQDPLRLDIPAKLQTPSLAHWFGTDHSVRYVPASIWGGALFSSAAA